MTSWLNWLFLKLGHVALNRLTRGQGQRLSGAVMHDGPANPAQLTRGPTVPRLVAAASRCQAARWPGAGGGGGGGLQPAAAAAALPTGTPILGSNPDSADQAGQDEIRPTGTGNRSHHSSIPHSLPAHCWTGCPSSQSRRRGVACLGPGGGFKDGDGGFARPTVTDPSCLA